MFSNNTVALALNPRTGGHTVFLATDGYSGFVWAGLTRDQVVAARAAAQSVLDNPHPQWRVATDGRGMRRPVPVGRWVEIPVGDGEVLFSESPEAGGEYTTVDTIKVKNANPRAGYGMLWAVVKVLGIPDREACNAAA